MLAGTAAVSHFPANPAPRLFVTFAAAGCLALFFLSPSPAAPAADPGRVDGLLISVPNPISSGGVNQIRDRVDDARRKNKGIKTIIFDFNPSKGPVATSNPYPCLELADYLLTLKSEFTTVAFVHDKVTRHTVLPVLACSELVMADNAAIGDVQGGKGKALNETMRWAYDRYARLKNPIDPKVPSPLVLKMVYKDIELGKRKLGHSWIYVDMSKVDENEKANYEAFPLQGGASLYRASEASSCNLCQGIINTLDRVAYNYRLSDASMREGVLPGEKKARRVSFTGPVTRAKVQSLIRQMDSAIHEGANFFILELECETGEDTQAAMDFAVYLLHLMDDKNTQRVETVAYIPPGRSLGAATAIALGCTEIVMGKGAVLGDYDFLKARNTIWDVKKPLVGDENEPGGLAEAKRYPVVLVQGMVDRDLVIYRVRSKNHPNYHFFVSKKEFDRDQKEAQSMIREGQIKGPGELLKLTADTAYDYGLCRLVVGDIADVYRHYNLDNAQVRDLTPGLLDDIAAFFRSPVVRLMLVMIGIVGLILEMKMPGLGLPGVVAAVCFVLFFWANSTISGEFTWLAILLFALGLILIGLEVFVMPGMAVFGISGVVLVVFSLVLVTLDKAPTTTRGWWELGGTLAAYSFSLVAAIVVAILIARYLPQIPYANRLVLTPPTEKAEPLGEARAGETGGSAALLGAIGESATPLRPAGKARFGDNYLDVMAEGSYVDSGKLVKVVEIEGNRVVVKEV
jgi:membrane-bound ClpP family serine protease